MIELFLTKIAFAFLDKAALGSSLSVVLKAYEIYSVFDAIADSIDCVRSANDCRELNVCGLQVVSDPVAKHGVDYLVGVGKDVFVVDKTTSGLYIASALVPAFRVPSTSGLVVRDHRRYRRDHRVDHRADRR